MGNKLDPFEKELKSTLENIEMPYTSSAWSEVSHQLPSSSNSLAYLVVGFLAMATFFSIVTPSVPSQNKQRNFDSLVIADTEETPIIADTKVTENSAISLQEPSSNEVDMNITPQKEKVEIGDNAPSTDVDSTTIHEPNGAASTTSRPITPPVDERKSQKVMAFEIQATATTICAYEQITFTSSAPTQEHISWWVNGEVVSHEAEFTYTFKQAGEFEIRAYYQGTSNVASEALYITVHPKPDARFSVVETIVEDAIPVVQLQPNSLHEKSYDWTFGDGVSSRETQAEHVYKAAKDYEIGLRVTNAYGCVQQSFKRYTNHKPYNLLAPNSFSPNYDGVNDQWIPKALITNFYTFELKIFDRTNKEIFATSSADNAWDGSVNGNIASSGEVFFWKAFTIDKNGTRAQFGGSIVVVY